MVSNNKFDSQIIIRLKKAIQSNYLDTNQQYIAEYVQRRFQETLNRLLVCTDHDLILQYKSELAVLKEILELVSNSKLNVLGDNNE